ncbi:hypothetical protein Cpir12675_000684 [Ceratocystis pirilliformis]|uniref:Major facilitator superfamily (MFS) profile domain-containing protein n=1 Tax=Ceratocystis pirilliformis TaxID=259994 RepID=A0ABR3ZJI8_9PEZI
MTASEIVGATIQDPVMVSPETETEPKGDHSLIIVTWDGPNDPQDPFNWSPRKKWLATGLGLFATCISLVNGSIITVAHEAINDEFGVSDANFPHSYWPVTSWGVGGALFSLVILPVMEDFGIRTVFLITYFLFICFLAPIGPTNSFAALVIVRFFSGGCVSILANTVVGILTNVFNGDRARSPAMSLYILIYLAASSSGPVIGAVIFDYLGWRWLGYAELIWTAVFMPLFVFGMPESRSSVLLRQKSKRMRAEGLNAYTIEELDTTPLIQIVAKSVKRPLYMLSTESVVFVSTLWSAFSLGTIYLFTQSVEQVYSELYGWDAVRSGYIQAAIVIGEILGWAFCLMTNHWYYNSAARNRESPGKPIPEARLYQAVIGGLFGVTGGMFVYAWTAYPDTRWEAPTVGLVVIGFGTTAVVQSISNYLIDAYSKYAGSAIAAVCLGENMFIALLPLAATSMYTTLGLHWASSLLGFISLAMTATPLAVLKWGRKIRDRSPFMKEATIEDRRLCLSPSNLTVATLDWKHFQATITTKFSVKCEEGELAIPAENDGAKVVRPKATPRKRSRKPEAGEAGEDRSVDDDADPATPSKKPRASQKKTEAGGELEKKAVKSSVQAEEKKKEGSDLSGGTEATAEESSEYGSDDKQG